MQYRIVLNKWNVILPWTTPATPPITINTTIPAVNFMIGNNLIEIEYRDENGVIQTYSKSVAFYNATTITTGDVTILTQGENTYIEFFLKNTDGHPLTYTLDQYDSGNVLKKTIKSGTADVTVLNGGKIQIT